MHENQRTVLHVFLSTNDVLKKMRMYKIHKFDQKLLSYKGTTKLDGGLKINWWRGGRVGWPIRSFFFIFANWWRRVDKLKSLVQTN